MTITCNHHGQNPISISNILAALYTLFFHPLQRHSASTQLETTWTEKKLWLTPLRGGPGIPLCRRQRAPAAPCAQSSPPPVQQTTPRLLLLYNTFYVPRLSAATLKASATLPNDTHKLYAMHSCSTMPAALSADMDDSALRQVMLCVRYNENVAIAAPRLLFSKAFLYARQRAWE